MKDKFSHWPISTEDKEVRYWARSCEDERWRTQWWTLPSPSQGKVSIKRLWRMTTIRVQKAKYSTVKTLCRRWELAYIWHHLQALQGQWGAAGGFLDQWTQPGVVAHTSNSIIPEAEAWTVWMWWFEWQWSSQAHQFEYLVPSWWAVKEWLEGVALLENCHWNGLPRFKSPHHSQSCSLCYTEFQVSVPGCPGTHSFDDAGLELTKIHLPLPPKCWD